MATGEGLALALAAVAGFLATSGVALLGLLDPAGVLPLGGAALCFALARAVSAHRVTRQRRRERARKMRARSGPAGPASVPAPESLR